MIDTCIVTTVYGERHLNWLGPFIESIHAIPGAPIVYVVHGNRTDVSSYVTAYHDVRWLEYDEEAAGDERVVKVGRKIRGLRIALNIIRDGTRVVFSDVDTLWLKHPDAAWAENAGSIQFGYTVKEGRWPINSGVVFGEVSERLRWEFKSWEVETERWMATPEKIKEATDAAGHPDQMALKKIVAMMPETTGMSAKKLPAVRWNHDEYPKKGGSLSEIGCLHLQGCLPLLLGERTPDPPPDYEQAFVSWREFSFASAERRGA